LETELIHKYLSGECTEMQKAEVERWLNDSIENQEVMKNIKQIWDVPPGSRIQVDAENAWELFKNRVLDESNVSSREVGSEQKVRYITHEYERNDVAAQNRFVRMIAYVSAVAAVLIIAFLFSYSSPHDDVTPLFELSMQEITTEKGQRTMVRLSDGTRVQLNGESKLMIPGNFTENHRIVTLEGEAFFEVEPSRGINFYVHANNSITQVLGTKFNVRAYPDEEIVEVVVTEGKVSMSLGDEYDTPEVQLTQNQRGTLNKNGEVIASTISDIEFYMGWTLGKLTFKGATIEEVKNKLERWYDIEVELGEGLSTGDRLLTGTFENAPMSVVLTSISLSLDMKYNHEGKRVVFTLN